MKIKRVTARCFERNVLGVFTKRLKRCDQGNGNLRLIGTEKHLDLERTTLEQADVLGLHILKINKDEISTRGHGHHFLFRQ